MAESPIDLLDFEAWEYETKDLDLETFHSIIYPPKVEPIVPDGDLIDIVGCPECVCNLPMSGPGNFIQHTLQEHPLGINAQRIRRAMGGSQ